VSAAKANKNTWLMISWAPYSRMSDTFAKELNGKLYCIHYLRFQYPPVAPIKYIMQAVRTMAVLLSEKPRVIHVQNPPFIAGMVANFYCRLTGAKFVLHYHSAAFAKNWDWALPFQKLIARRASANIVTNQHWADIITNWGGNALVMTDPFLELPKGDAYPVSSSFNLAFVSTFAEDEPTDAVMEAARAMPDVHFYITGDKRKKPATFFENTPANVTFTGFLSPDTEYPGLLHSVDAVMVLTTRDYTLQLGGCEAAAVKKPLVTSDFPYLREVFSRGTAFVLPDPKSIEQGIRSIQQDYAHYCEEIAWLRSDKQQEWNLRLSQLKHLVGLDHEPA
jgi:glycosyltransferase involved in cell wall biosynthesis